MMKEIIEIIIDAFSIFKEDKKNCLCGILCGIVFIGWIYVLALIQYVYFL